MTFQDADYFAPRYLITIEGTKLREDITQYIAGTEYEEAENTAAKIVLEVNNPGLRFLDERVFAEGNSVDLWMGYAGSPLVFQNRGIIVKPEPSFPRAGIPTMTITAYDLSQRLMTTPSKDRGKVYSKLRDSEIATQIFKDEGIAPFVFQTKSIGTRVRKKGVTRWKFLRSLAKLHGFVIYVRYSPEERATIGYFGPSETRDQPKRYKFIYGTGEPDATLLEFHPKMSLPSQSTMVEIAYTDPKSRKTIKVRAEVKKKDSERTRFIAATANDKLKKKIENGPSVTLTVLGQREELLADRKFASPGDAKRFAAAWFDRRQRDFVFGDGTLVGLPDLRLGQVHELGGLGPRFSGDWIFTKVVQRMGQRAFETDFEATKRVLKSVVTDIEGAAGTVLTEEAG